METRLLILTFQEVDTRYGLGQAELRQFLELGLLRPAPAPDTIEVEEPDELLPRLARLHHGLGLAPEAIDVVMLMRQRLLSLPAKRRGRDSSSGLSRAAGPYWKDSPNRPRYLWPAG
jgi:chaperone modulatory protein CbpM